jgi:MFS family permease
MGMFSIGSIIGYICIGSLADNFGRKLAFNGCLCMATIGNFFVLIAPNLILAEIGLFMMGFGL